jgi:hypothetical protein
MRIGEIQRVGEREIPQHGANRRASGGRGCQLRPEPQRCLTNTRPGELPQPIFPFSSGRSNGRAGQKRGRSRARAIKIQRQGCG